MGTAVRCGIVLPRVVLVNYALVKGVLQFPGFFRGDTGLEEDVFQVEEPVFCTAVFLDSDVIQGVYPGAVFFR